MPVVAVVSMEQCAKTYEVRHTPTPVRVTKVPPGADFGALARPRAGSDGTSTGAGRVVQLISFTEHYRPQSGTEMEAAGGRARVLPTVRWVAREKG